MFSNILVISNKRLSFLVFNKNGIKYDKHIFSILSDYFLKTFHYQRTKIKTILKIYLVQK